jgi:hypothetical protein
MMEVMPKREKRRGWCYKHLTTAFRGFCVIAIAVLNAHYVSLAADIVNVALYPTDNRRLMTEADALRFAGAGA